MKALEVRPLRTAGERRTFLCFPWRIYKGDRLWVPPLLPERARVIDPRRGTFFRHGQAEFFIAWRGQTPVGTVCAAEDAATNRQRGRRECLFGFLEYVEDEEVFAALIQRVIDWARARGLNALFGPFNLDYEDGYGVLIEGRDRPPALLCGHSPPYYQLFMERFGFEPARGDNLAYAFDLQQDTPALQQLARLAARARQRTPVKIRQADPAAWRSEVDNVHRLLNTALAHLPDFIPWQREEVEAIFDTFRQIADPELVLFAGLDGQTIGFFPGLPNLNEAFIHAGGLRYPWNFLTLWRHMRSRPACLAIKSVLVQPEYWGSGASILLFDEMLRRARAKGYRWADLSLTSADNPKTPMLAERLGAKIYKRYRVYRFEI